MTMLCGSTTSIVIFPAGMPREEVKVQCHLDDAHTDDHRGRFGGASFTWPRKPGVTVYPLDGDCPRFPDGTNAACRIKVNAPTPWATEPSNPIDDIRASADHVRRVHLAGQPRMSPDERRHYNYLGQLLSAAAARLPPLRPEPFPIEDAGPHPKDADR